MLFTIADQCNYSFISPGVAKQHHLVVSQITTVLKRSDWERRNTKPYDYNGYGFKCFSCPLKHVFAGRKSQRCSVNLLKIQSCRSLLRTEHRGCTCCSNKCFSFFIRCNILSVPVRQLMVSCLLAIGGEGPQHTSLWWPSLRLQLAATENTHRVRKFPVTVVRIRLILIIAVADHILYPSSSCILKNKTKWSSTSF